MGRGLFIMVLSNVNAAPRIIRADIVLGAVYRI